jgi:hypothetical protein
MVEQPIEQRRDGGGVAEEFAPVLDGAVGGDQRGRFFVAAHDDLEEILGRGVRQLPHGEIVDHEERDGGELRQVWLPRARQLGIREFLEQHVGFAVEHAMALLDHGEANRLRQVAFARAGRPVKQSVFVLGHEAAGGELEHEAAGHLLVEVKVEGVEGLPTVAEAGLRDAAVEEPVLAAQELVLDKRGEEIDGGQRDGLGLQQPRLEAGGHAGAAELPEGAL